MERASTDRRQSRVQPDEPRRRREIAGLVSELIRLAREVGDPDPPAWHDVIRQIAVFHRLDLRSAGAEVVGLVVAQRASATPALWLTFAGVAGAWSVWMGPATAWAVQPALVELISRMHGDELEIDASLAGEHPIVAHSTFVHPDGWWPSFKARAATDPALTLGDVYERCLYPPVIDVLARAPGRVLDLGGGDGALAARLLDAGAAHDVVSVDRNVALVAAARARLHGRPATVVAADLRDPSWVDAAPGSFDAIVAVGLLESNVLHTPVARAALGAAWTRLRPGGVLVATGTGASLVSAAHLEALGAVVTNRTLPPELAGCDVFPLYVARKPV